ncbi:MAG: ABC transporter permease [Micrococcales bacterium 70-64]|nr:sugar ABC transporter permease [Leifsonia sp.]ODU63596.1 MAG: ABC transporter permease [Leifsonia sp. SCN 70-46]OJX85287.1 MAG: ABC transporter permease [Micrococcales bacterium 70-64]
MKSVFGDRRAIVVLLAPALTVYTLVMLVPVLWSFVLTFFKGNALEGFRFVGVDNFVRLFSDPYIWDALLFTLKYAVLMTAGQIICGYGLALLYTFVLRRTSTILRTLIFFPNILPTVAIAVLYQKLFQSAPADGVVNNLLTNLGIGSVDWLGNDGTAFVVIIIMDLWRSMGFYGVLLYAGLLDIPEEIIESARMDGARGWSLFRSIVLPMSLPILFSSIIFSINGTVKVFDSIYALTGGGPGNGTTPLTLYMYRTAFAYSDYGYGSTIAFLLTLICLVISLFIFRSSRRDVTL